MEKKKVKVEEKAETLAGVQVGIKAPRGSKITCKSWQTEAAMRMLMNNLDPEVAEKPAELIVYGGSGKAARNWEAYHLLVKCLQNLENDETLLVQSGKPVGIFRTQEDALILALGAKEKGIPKSIGLLGNAAEIHPEIIKRGIVPDLVTDQTSAHDALNGYVPAGLSLEEALELRRKDSKEYIRRAMESMGVHVRAMLEFQKMGSVVFDYGNNIHAQAFHYGIYLMSNVKAQSSNKT